MKNIYTFAFFAVSQLLDFALTYHGLRLGFPEGNPLIVWLIGILGVLPTLVLAKGMALVFGAAFAIFDERNVILTILTVMMYVVCVFPWVWLFAWGM